jgi:hypothetical protein
LPELGDALRASVSPGGGDEGEDDEGEGVGVGVGVGVDDGDGDLDGVDGAGALDDGSAGDTGIPVGTA